MTYSIVARDAVSGQLGAAVQSRWFSVGSVVTWSEAGVGAVATQSFAEPAYGPRGLDLMRNGMSAPDALRVLVAADPGEARRQVAMVDAAGQVDVHTGSGCVEAAGHATAPGVSAQANMMERDTVWDAMVATFLATDGDLADRMLAALDAAEAEGGDVRGCQSAALLVVAGESIGEPLVDTVCDLRVEDHPQPLAELRRLLALRRAYDTLDRALDLTDAGNLPEAVAEAGRAAELAPVDDQIALFRALLLARVGDLDQARRLVADAARAEPRWLTFLPRLVQADVVLDASDLDALRSRGK